MQSGKGPFFLLLSCFKDQHAYTVSGGQRLSFFGLTVTSCKDWKSDGKDVKLNGNAAYVSSFTCERGKALSVYFVKHTSLLVYRKVHNKC